MALNTTDIRGQFPILNRSVDGNPLVYLDNAATAQKPTAVLDAMDEYYRTHNANVHRGMHVLAEEATVAYEDARAAVQKFLNAKHASEITFTKSCTESLNLVADSWGRSNLGEDDVIVLSILEHHSNIVPWQQVSEETGCSIEWIDIDDNGNLQRNQLDTYLDRGNVKLVSITGQSNVTGTRPDLTQIITKAHAAGALVCVDAAQLISHHKIDVQKLDCDFLAFSAHKLYGPTGIGVLYGKRRLLEAMPPYLGGGMMIHEVYRDHFSPADLPAKFEAGTPPIAEAVGLHAAMDWLAQFAWPDVEAHESSLLEAVSNKLEAVSGLSILCDQRPALRQSSGQATRDQRQSGCISFTIEGIHPHDLTEILGRKGICLRAGHHCAQPLHDRLGVKSSTRVSVGIYNTEEEITILTIAIEAARGLLGS